MTSLSPRPWTIQERESFWRVVDANGEPVFDEWVEFDRHDDAHEVRQLVVDSVNRAEIFRDMVITIKAYLDFPSLYGFKETMADLLRRLGESEPAR